MSDFIWVDTNRKLASAKKEILASRMIGIDTEYDSFHYFREKLCLIQIKSERKIYLLDPLNFLNLSFLGDSFSNPDIPKIVHAGDNDIRLLKRDFGFEFKNVFDTQRAAAALGYRQLSLASVVQGALGIELKKNKRIQRSQWDVRPLSDEQKEYAAQDIEHLFELYEALRKELEKRGLEEKARQAFVEIAAVRWSEKTLDPYGYLRIAACQDLKKNQKERLKALYQWRFQKAKSTNTAVFMVLSDQDLIEISRFKIQSLYSLKKNYRIAEGKINRFGAEIVEVLNSADDSRALQAGEGQLLV